MRLVSIQAGHLPKFVDEEKPVVDKRLLILTGIVVPLSFLVILSPFMPWEGYTTITHIYKVFTLIPSPLGDAAWIFYDIPLLSIISYLPLIGGLIVLIGFLVYLLEFKIGRTILLLGALVGILAYVFYVLIWGLPMLLITVFGQAFAQLMLSMIGFALTFTFTDKSFIPNFYGAYVCLIPCIVLFVSRFFMKMPEYDESLEEFKGFAEKDMKTPYEAKKAEVGTIFCPTCGASVKSEELFCKECGTYM
ncbi:MAG: zinc ribbon domain-containing protein [Candidatus Helarchaeota archaeon]